MTDREAVTAVTAVTPVNPVTSMTPVIDMTSVASAVTVTLLRPRRHSDRRDVHPTATRTPDLKAANAATLGSPTDPKCPMAMSYRCRAYVATSALRQDRALEAAGRLVN